MDKIEYRLDSYMRKNSIGRAFWVEFCPKAMFFGAPYSNAQRFFSFLHIVEQSIGRVLESLYSYMRVPLDKRPAGLEFFHVIPERNAISIDCHFPKIIDRWRAAFPVSLDEGS